MDPSPSLPPSRHEPDHGEDEGEWSDQAAELRRAVAGPHQEGHQRAGQDAYPGLKVSSKLHH